MFVSNNFALEFKFNPALLVAGKTWLYTLFLVSIFFVMWLFAWFKGIGKNPKTIMQAKEKDKDIYTGLEQAHFQTDKEIQNNFKTVDYINLPKTDIEGIPVKAEETADRKSVV